MDDGWERPYGLNPNALNGVWGSSLSDVFVVSIGFEVEHCVCGCWEGVRVKYPRIAS